MLIMIMFFGGCVNDTPAVGHSLISEGDRLPQFEVTMSDGTKVSTSDLEGAPSVVVLFTTSCGDCRELLPVLEELHRARPELRLVLISRRQSASALARYWEENSLTMPYSPQPDAAVYSLFATSGVPRVYISDAALTVTALWDDTQLPTLARLEAAIAPLFQ